MSVVWDLGDCTSAQVIAEFTKKRALAATTIRTVLAKLREKGYVKPIPSLERGYLLRSTVPRESVARRSMKELLAPLFRGSPKQAIAHLLDGHDISDEELEELSDMIARRKQQDNRR